MAQPRDEPRDPEEPGMARRLVAEAAGTFALTFVAAGGDAAARVSGGQVEPTARAIAPGLLVMAFVYALGDRSGAHFNPVVTLAFTLRRLFPAAWAPGYVIAQLAGATGAAIAIAIVFGSAMSAGVSTPHVAWGSALLLEAALTWLLITVILGTADRYRIIGPNAAIAVGATIALCGLIALPVEGASMNPARSTGPAIVAGQLGDLWIYWLAPILGSLSAVVFTWLLRGPAPADSKPAEAARGK